jgi:hypothetical protein
MLLGRTLSGVAPTVEKPAGAVLDSFVGSTPCRNVGCGPCYETSIGDPFPIQAPADEDWFESIVTGYER